jgi:REP element-mobilizing transposase RayT
MIEACVLRADHMHALSTLSPGDEDFSRRWGVSKRMVTRRCQTRLNRPEWITRTAESGTKVRYGSINFGNISSAMTPTSGISITSIGAR